MPKALYGYLGDLPGYAVLAVVRELEVGIQELERALQEAEAETRFLRAIVQSNEQDVWLAG